MIKFLKKRKADKIQKLKTKIIKLEEENEGLRREVFSYRLKRGKVIPKPIRRKTKLMGKMGEGALDD